MAKTVKVRIAVAVDHKGYWNATGWQDAEENLMRDLAIEGVSDGEQVYWVTAELPIPESVDVKGNVELT